MLGVTVFVVNLLLLCHCNGEKTPEYESLRHFVAPNIQRFLRTLTYDDVLRGAFRAASVYRVRWEQGRGESPQLMFETSDLFGSGNDSKHDPKRIYGVLSHIQDALLSFSPVMSKTAKLTSELASSSRPTSRRISDYEACSMDMNQLFGGTGRRKAWAIRMIDAWGKPVAGLAQSRPIFLGQFDECLETVVTDYDIKPQYCIETINFTQIGLLSFPQPLPILLGVCVPSSCSAHNLTNVLSGYIAVQHNIEGIALYGQCYNPDLPFSRKAIAALVICSIIAVLLVTASLYDILVVHGAWRVVIPPAIIAQGYTNNGDSVDQGEGEPLLNAQVERKRSQLSASKRALLRFSVYTNASKLLSTKTGLGSIDCIHGIRFLSMSWVILGHSFAMGMQIDPAIHAGTDGMSLYFRLPPPFCFRLIPPYMLVLMIYVTLLQIDPAIYAGIDGVYHSVPPRW
ncbi:nose resistant to fluoxetine protein 6 [Elysia marginata]|uniref:Nose resistant to fluoxetine protein 6 n=1 Tax=Elysia marginata TaxID=1093978 RepID=A0AAV4GW04_9GAST|nr:nose resistant to fluoxetine protein 6 [Elysia marginata]